MITTVEIRNKHLTDESVTTYTAISSLSDLPAYFEATSNHCVEHFTEMLKKNASPEQWDISLRDNAGKSTFMLAVKRAKAKGNNPVNNLDRGIAERFATFTKYISQGYTILVNPVGGWCFLDAKNHDVISEKPFSFDDNKMENVTINENTRYINLENDPILEQHTKDYLGDLDSNYSYITHLRSFSVSELTEIFELFKQKGGETVYVYTTGSDVAQMHDYAEAIINAGVNNVVFEFNAGFQDEFNAVIEQLESGGVSITHSLVSST